MSDKQKPGSALGLLPGFLPLKPAMAQLLLSLASLGLVLLLSIAIFAAISIAIGSFL